MKRKTTAALVTLAWGGLTLTACGVLHLDFYVPERTGTGGTVGSTATSSSAGGTGGAPPCAPEAMQPCYDGPAGTEGVGICKGGTETCAADGSGWGPCVGEVLPKVEDCTTGMDQACDGNPAVCKGTTLWAERFGDASAQQGNGIATDATGNVLVTGFVTGSANFGGVNGALTSAGAADMFVAKFDPAGAPMWSELFGDASDQEGESIATDSAGNVVVTGLVLGSVTVGATKLTSAGGADIFVAKLGPNGAPQWGRLFGDASDQEGKSIATDSAGNILVTGYAGGSVDFGANVGTLTSAGAGDIFVAKLDPSGTPLWAKLFGDASNQEGTGIATDSAGDVLVTGSVAGSVDFGKGKLTSPGGNATFVAKFDPTGVLLWAKLFGDASEKGNSATGIAADASGNVLVTGFASGAIDFGSPTKPLTSAGGDDIFVAKLDPNGTPLWSEIFGDTSDQEGMGIAVDPSSNVVVTGYFGGAVDFGSGTGQLVSAGPEAIFVAKFTPDGAALWSKAFGDPQDNAGLDIATDTSSSVFVTGYIEGTVDFGISPSLTSKGGEDIFVAKLSP